MSSFQIFLDFSHVVLRLLHDEIPEVRSKMASLLAKVYHQEGHPDVIKYNSNYMLEVYYKYIITKYHEITKNANDNDRELLCRFILTYALESEFDRYFELAHYEKRIF